MLPVPVFFLLPAVRVGGRAPGLATLGAHPPQHGLQLNLLPISHLAPTVLLLLLLFLIQGQGQLRKVRAVCPVSSLEGQAAVRQRVVLKLLLLRLLLLLVEVRRGAVVVRRGVGVERMLRLGRHVCQRRPCLALKVEVFLSKGKGLSVSNTLASAKAACRENIKKKT